MNAWEDSLANVKREQDWLAARFSNEKQRAKATARAERLAREEGMCLIDAYQTVRREIEQGAWRPTAPKQK